MEVSTYENGSNTKSNGNENLQNFGLFSNIFIGITVFFSNLCRINMDGVEGTLYEGEHFQLLFKFNNKYPFDSPGTNFSFDFKCCKIKCKK